MRIRNSIEWIIRINKVIHNFTYATRKSYEYVQLMESPLEETENSQMYAFYLEDAVYRDIVLWDLLRQFMNVGLLSMMKLNQIDASYLGKGLFAQLLLEKISTTNDFIVPEYIKVAIRFVLEITEDNNGK